MVAQVVAAHQDLGDAYKHDVQADVGLASTLSSIRPLLIHIRAALLEVVHSGSDRFQAWIA